MTPQTEQKAQTAPDDTAEDRNHLKAAAKKAYGAGTAVAEAGDQVEQFLPMVHKIVQRVVTYLKPPLSYEDLVSAGTVGLVKAARDYDPSRDAQFKTYAYLRVKGAVLDELRGWSFVPAAVNREIRRVAETAEEMTAATGTAPKDEELAEKLGISVEELYNTYKGARAKNFISIDNTEKSDNPLSAILAASDASRPETHMEQSELLERLTRAIEDLNEKQRQVVILYYQQQLTMKQIAEVFGITESRVSQLHASALFNLSVKLRQDGDGEQ